MSEETAVEVQGTEATVLRFEATLALEGVRTGDGREFSPDALTWRDLPLPLMLLTKTGQGHDGAEIAGQIEQIERVENRVVGKGFFTDNETGREAARLVGERTLRGVSVDLDIVDVEYVTEDGETAEMDLIDMLMGGEEKVIARFNEARVMGATICAFPAFQASETEIVLTAAAIEISDGIELQPTVWAVTNDGSPVTFSLGRESVLTACATCDTPPKAWFESPAFGAQGLDYRLAQDPASGQWGCPLTVTDDGQVFGHAALWGACHTGFQDRCVTVPRSTYAYAHFMRGAVKTDDGIVRAGPITVGTGHASTRPGVGGAEALAHYDNTGWVGADVAVGEDEYGIWVAGAVRAGTSAAQMHALRAAALSGDWRDFNGALELFALLAVNAPGFFVPRGLVASWTAAESARFGMREREGKVVALTAAGRVSRIPAPVRRLLALEERLAAMEQHLQPVIVRELRARIHGL